MSDVDDEELAALRAEALASLKEKSSSNSSVVPSGSKNVAPISTVMASSSYSSYNAGDQSNYPNLYSWRNQPQNNRRGRGGGRSFPKVNQRSNLIVITPVAPEEKNSDEKGSTSQLVLPQHKWCQSINEDSSSPRSFKKTGPTRFNRHESDSDSSDSEPELSDNDSYSNETILQDEPSDHYGTRSGRSVSRDSTPEKSVSERRLSFQNIDPAHDSFPNRESTSVYKCLKNTYTNSSDNRLEVRSSSAENDTDHSWKHRNERTLPYMPSDNVSDNKRASHVENSSKSQTVNGESSHKRKLSNVLSAEGKHCPQAETFRDGSLSPQSRKAGGLSKNDLRLELKKRMQEMTQNLQARSNDRVRRSSHSPTSRGRSYRRVARSRSRSTNGHRSQSLGRKRSPSKDRRRHRHNSDYPLKKEHSPSPVLDHSKKEPTHSPHRNPKQSSSSSSDRSSKDRSRSPRHRYRRNRSSSSDRSRKSRTRSPLIKNKRVDSPVSDICQRNKSRSPRRSHKRVDSPVSDISRRNRSRSPHHNHKRDDSPASVSQRNQSRSPRRNHKREDSPASVSQRNRSRSPRRNRKRDDSPASVSLKNRSHSPRHTQKRANSPTSVNSRNRSRSPNRKHRRDSSSSSDRSRKNRSRSPGKNQNRQHSWSSDDRQDRSPSNPSRKKRERSPSPAYSRRDSKHLNKGGRHRDRSSTSSESSGSSRHSSSVGRLRSVSSVVNKPVSVVSKVDVKERIVSSESDSQYEKNKLDRVKPIVSSVKSSVESKSSASDGQKRVPVHMRLGTLPGKRVIQMTKDVEAAFVNTSSDEGGDEANGRHKKDNLHLMYKANDGKNDESSKRHVHRNVVQSDTFKEGRFKHRR